MTPQEQEMIDGLVSRVRNTQLTDKDPDAEHRLQQGLAGYPDTIYVLAQTVLVQGYGLEQAQGQIEQLRGELEHAKQAAQHPSGGFLSKIFGTGATEANAGQTSASSQPPYQPVGGSGYPPAPPPQSAYPQPYQGGSGGAYPPSYAPGPGYAPAPGYGAPGYGSSGGDFLRGALQTAAGVAAGEMVFDGMESLFHGFGGGGGYGGNEGGRPGETVINNYYDDDRGGGGGRQESGRDDARFYNPSDDASRQDLGGASDTANFADDRSDDNDGGTQGFADNGSDDIGNDDLAGNFEDDSATYDDPGSGGSDDSGSF